MRTREGTALPTQTECTICLSNDSLDIGLLKCKHTFCFPCIESWSEHENSCPLCKVRFTFIDRVQTSANGKPEKTRVKSKKRNQADYDARHPSQTTHDEAIATWTNIILGMTGTGSNNPMSRFIEQHLTGNRNTTYAVQHSRNGATVRALPQASRGGGLDDFLASARLAYAPPRRTASAPPRRTHGTENNPIELSDDENTGAMRPRGTGSSSGSGAQPRSSSSSTVVDLIDLTDDAEYVPSSSSTAVAASLAPPRPVLGLPAHFHTHTHTAANAGHTAPPFHPAAAMSSFGNYNLMDFLSDEEDDEDYEPPRFDEDAELDDDRSDLSEDISSVNEVIELPDSDEEVAVALRSSAPAGAASSARLSGIMVWCHECDSYHDKQRVYDDVSYCPTTYASLVSTDGFSDIRQDRAGTSSSGGGAASSASRSEAVAHPPLANSRMPLVGSVYSVRVVEETELTSDDSTTSGQWRGRSSAPSASRSSASAARAGATSSAGNNDWEDEEEEEEFEVESDLARTMSDATTASSRSRASQAATQAMPAEARTQCSDGDGDLAQTVTSAATTQCSSSSGGAKSSSKRANWLAYLEEEEEAAEARDKRQRTESSGGVAHQEF